MNYREGGRRGVETQAVVQLFYAGNKSRFCALAHKIHLSPPPLPSPSGADNPGPGDNVWSDLSRDVPPYEEGRHTQRPRRQKHLVRTCLLIVLMSLVTRVPYSGTRLCVRGESLVSFIM